MSANVIKPMGNICGGKITVITSVQLHESLYTSRSNDNRGNSITVVTTVLVKGLILNTKKITILSIFL